MKKFSVAIIMTIILIFSVGATQISASSWHKGTPRALRGSWRSKMTKSNDYHNKYHWVYTYFKIAPNEVIGAYSTQSDSLGIINPKYKYIGNHTYKIKGRWMGKTVWTIKKVNSQKIRFNLFGNKYTNFYKYSGIRSKHTFYPYPL